MPLTDESKENENDENVLLASVTISQNEVFPFPPFN